MRPSRAHRRSRSLDTPWPTNSAAVATPSLRKNTDSILSVTILILPPRAAKTYTAFAANFVRVSTILCHQKPVKVSGSRVRCGVAPRRGAREVLARITGRGRLQPIAWLVCESFGIEESTLSAPDDHALAADLAERAGRLLLNLRAQGGDPGRAQ